MPFQSAGKALDWPGLEGIVLSSGPATVHELAAQVNGDAKDDFDIEPSNFTANANLTAANFTRLQANISPNLSFNL